MPLLRPMTHSNSYTAAYYSQTPLPGQPFWINFDMGEPQGVYVREADGHYVKTDMDEESAYDADYAFEDVFVVGRDGYYLTMAEARTAIADQVHGVSYQDMYEEEFQDVFVSDPVHDPKIQPFVETHVAEPIR